MAVLLEGKPDALEAESTCLKAEFGDTLIIEPPCRMFK
jgi:hypothetical protein